MKIYKERTMIIAEHARNLCVEKGIIKKETCALNKEELININKVFGGELEFVKEINSFEKTGEKSYKIYCDDNDEDYILNVLAGLGIAFFEMDNMKNKDKIENFTKRYNFNQDVSELFARGFLMPRDVFEKKLVKYIDNGVCNITKVAEEYNISECNVLIRGEELHNFR